MKALNCVLQTTTNSYEFSLLDGKVRIDIQKHFPFENIHFELHESYEHLFKNEFPAMFLSYTSGTACLSMSYCCETSFRTSEVTDDSYNFLVMPIAWLPDFCLHVCGTTLTEIERGYEKIREHLYTFDFDDYTVTQKEHFVESLKLTDDEIHENYDYQDFTNAVKSKVDQFILVDMRVFCSMEKHHRSEQVKKLEGYVNAIEFYRCVRNYVVTYDDMYEYTEMFLDPYKKHPFHKIHQYDSYKEKMCDTLTKAGRGTDIEENFLDDDYDPMDEIVDKVTCMYFNDRISILCTAQYNLYFESIRFLLRSKQATLFYQIPENEIDDIKQSLIKDLIISRRPYAFQNEFVQFYPYSATIDQPATGQLKLNL